jgi:hypothetical protein
MKFSKISSYVYFGLGVVLLTVASAIKVTCPVDHGTGRIAGAAYVQVTDVEYSLDKLQTFDTGCAEIYSDFTYTVNITFKNTSQSASAGALLVKFYDPDAVKGTMDLADAIAQIAAEQEVPESAITVSEEISKGGQVATFLALPVATQFVFVEVPGGANKTITQTINFRGFGFTEVSKFGSSGVTHVVSVAPPTQAIVCPYCNGTGKVDFPEWLRLTAGAQ